MRPDCVGRLGVGCGGGGGAPAGVVPGRASPQPRADQPNRPALPPQHSGLYLQPPAGPLRARQLAALERLGLGLEHSLQDGPLSQQVWGCRSGSARLEGVRPSAEPLAAQRAHIAACVRFRPSAPPSPYPALPPTAAAGLPARHRGHCRGAGGGQGGAGRPAGRRSQRSQRGPSAAHAAGGGAGRAAGGVPRAAAGGRRRGERRGGRQQRRRRSAGGHSSGSGISRGGAGGAPAGRAAPAAVGSADAAAAGRSSRPTRPAAGAAAASRRAAAAAGAACERERV